MVTRDDKRLMQAYRLPKLIENAESRRTQRQSAHRLFLPSAISATLRFRKHYAGVELRFPAIEGLVTAVLAC